MDGVLVVDKPAGPTSHDVVARVRRVLHTKRIGHTGTLDPIATGVLPLVIGRATRLASLLAATDKEYVAGIRLGAATDTYDAAGLKGPAPEPPQHIDAAVIKDALASFRGTFDQSPPAYSAKKIKGVPAYRLARRHTAVQPAAVRVSVSALALEAYQSGLAHVRVCASAGFYVRSLAHDLGTALGCGAYLETLRRVRAGGFDQTSATPLEDIERDSARALALLVPLDRLLPHMPAVMLNERGVRRAAHGNDLLATDVVEPSSSQDEPAVPRRCRLLDGNGALIGIAESRTGGLLRPVIVLV